MTPLGSWRFVAGVLSRALATSLPMTIGATSEAGSHRDVATAVAVAPAPSPWVRGPAWDGFWMLSALWLVPIAAWLSHGYSKPEDGPLDLLYFGLTALFWIGHRLSSTYLAYCTEAYRPLLRTQPVRFVVLPLLVTAACFAVFLPPDTALPWSREARLVALAILDYVFVTYHFAAQHFGALSLYRARVGRGAGARTRTMDRLFALGVGGVLVFLADVLAGAVAYQDRWLDRWVVPDVAGLVAGRDSRRRHRRAAGRDGRNAGRRAARTAMVLAARAVRRWESRRWSPSLSVREACFSSSSSGRRSTGFSRPASPPAPRPASRRRCEAPCAGCCTA